MIKPLFTFAALSALTFLAFARENPFFPSSEKKEPSSNIQPVESVFTTELLRIPIEAVKIKTISVEYLRSDGGISVATYEIEKLFNSNRYMVVSQEGGISFGEMPASAQCHKDENATTKENLKKKPKKKTETAALTKDIHFEFGENSVTLSNTDEKIRDFTINEEGYKIVLDFYKSKDVKEKILDVIKPPFKKAAVGDHEKFYRIAVELYEPHRYKVEKIAGGYRIIVGETK